MGWKGDFNYFVYGIKTFDGVVKSPPSTDAELEVEGCFRLESISNRLVGEPYPTTLLDMLALPRASLAVKNVNRVSRRVIAVSLREALRVRLHPSRIA